MTCTWIQTYTGLALDLDDPKPEQIDAYDIAHALSLVPRYTGHARGLYSVGQHSLHVAELVAKWGYLDLRLPALLHDAPEYALGDWSSPIKQLMRLHAPYMLELEARFEIAIRDRFKLPVLTPAQHQLIKQADLVMLATEKRDFMGPSPRADWGASSGHPLQEPLPERLWIHEPEHVERRFLQCFREFGGDLRP